jgi:pyrroloquinoline quinone biosynthesis protein B
MRVRLLGTAAGGGFPQWNCNCENCRGLRAGTIQARPRTQSCMALSVDDRHWFLLNASPDIRIQIESFPPLIPPSDVWRGTSVAGVLLTDADLDHTLGLFLLREGLPLTIYATTFVRHALTAGLTLSATLECYCNVQWREPAHELTPLRYEDGSASGLSYAAYPIAGKPPRYMELHAVPQPGDRVGYRFVDEKTGGRLLFLPGLAFFDEVTQTYLQECDALLLDGTFWDEREMEERLVGTTPASQMGHLPVGGPYGSLAYIASLPIARKIYTHINNTNPMLVEDSAERAAVRAAGVEIGWDGLELTV